MASIDSTTWKSMFPDAIELSSAALRNSDVLSVSDEFFAKAINLIQRKPAVKVDGFGPNGKIFDGWESQRHNQTFDCCIIKLGTTGRICGFDIDTSHFIGNHAPGASVEALLASPEEVPDVLDPRWREILPKVELGPDSQHLYKLENMTTGMSHVKLVMHKDGGIARFRVYGHVVPTYPSDITKVFDLAHVFAGGCVTHVSDQHFGVGANLILPEVGENIGDGWETMRSREDGHKDWAVIKLGAPGVLDGVEIDTTHFKGNYPKHCELYAAFFQETPDWKSPKDVDEDNGWVLVLPRVPLCPDQPHYFSLKKKSEDAEDAEDGKGTWEKTYTHVKVVIFPDGGLQRVRILGRRSSNTQENLEQQDE